MILAQEQGAFFREAGAKKELEAEFGFDETEGTLILTDKRLIFACTDEKVDEVPVGLIGRARVIYAEVEDLGRIPLKPPNVFISIASISSVKAHGGKLGKPGLDIAWDDGGDRRSAVFTEELMGHEGKSLRDWAPVIEKLRSGTQKLVAIPQPPPIDTLQGRIVRVLSDMQEKGVLEIEETVEGEFKTELDPDEVQGACDELASKGLLRRYPDSSGDIFYRRASPLGEDDLSS